MGLNLTEEQLVGYTLLLYMLTLADGGHVLLIYFVIGPQTAVRVERGYFVLIYFAIGLQTAVRVKQKMHGGSVVEMRVCMCVMCALGDQKPWNLSSK